MAELGPSGEPQHAPLRRNLFGCQFTYDNINLLQCNGYSFDFLPDPEIFHEKYYDINYWKAQLAFRGASLAGNNMDELIERCIQAELPDRIHPRIAVATIHLSRRWACLTWGKINGQMRKKKRSGKRSGRVKEKMRKYMTRRLRMRRWKKMKIWMVTTKTWRRMILG
ncbi:hypothetical protein H4I96_06158 [Botrytis cinerea]